MKILLSVIICTYNRAEILEICLKKILKQKNAKGVYEVIVVNNNSSDNTPVIVHKYQKKFKNIKYIKEKNQGLSFARNKGYSFASGNYIIYIDDDVFVPDNYVTNIKKVIFEHRPDILGGPIYPYYLDKKPFWFKDEYEIRKYENKSGFSNNCRISGGNFIIRKKLLKKLGLFDVSLGMKGDSIGLGEEAKVLDTYRLVIPSGKQKVYYDLKCQVSHVVSPEKMKLSYLVKRSYQGGIMSIRMIGMNGRLNWGKYLELVLYNFMIFFQKLLHNILELFFHGVKEVKFVETLRRISFGLGVIIEGFKQLVR